MGQGAEKKSGLQDPSITTTTEVIAIHTKERIKEAAEGRLFGVLLKIDGTYHVVLDPITPTQETDVDIVHTAKYKEGLPIWALVHHALLDPKLVVTQNIKDVKLVKDRHMLTTNQDLLRTYVKTKIHPGRHVLSFVGDSHEPLIIPEAYKVTALLGGGIVTAKKLSFRPGAHFLDSSDVEIKKHVSSLIPILEQEKEQLRNFLGFSGSVFFEI